MRKMLITGARGFLGVRVAQYYAGHYEVIAIGHEEMDISDLESVRRQFGQHRPDVVIHCAAISDTGYAERHPGESFAVNVLGSEHVARACAEVGGKLLYMSSDQIYNGNAESGLLPELIEPCPVSVYGRDKLEAEARVRMVDPTAVGLRLTWMYDLPDSPLKLNRNLLVNLRQAHQEGASLRVATREYRGITDVWAVVTRLEACLRLPGGVYNFGSENRLNSYEIFIQVAQLLGYDALERCILPDTERFPKYPRNLAMDISRIRSYGIDFSDTLEGVRRAISPSA